MTNCYDTFLALSSAASIDADLPIAQGLAEAKTLLSRVQQRALSEMADGVKRQLGGILFSHAFKALDKPLFLNEPAVFEEAGASKSKTPAFPLFLGAAVTILLVVLELDAQKMPLLMGLIIGSVLLAVAGIFFALKAPGEKRQKVVITLNANALHTFMGEQMRMIDRDLDALDCLVPQQSEGEISDSALDAMMKILEIQTRSGTPNPEIHQAITHYLNQNGLTRVSYSEHNAPLFQTLPTLTRTRTLIPALLKGDHLIRQGLAIVLKEEVTQ